MPSKNSKVRSSPPGSLSAERKRIASYIGIALIALAMLAYILWRTVVIAENQQRFDAALQALAEQRALSVANYLNDTLKFLNPYTNSASTLELAKNQDKKQLQTISTIIKDNLPEAQMVRFYLPGEAQAIKDANGNMGFVLLNMINQLEAGETIYPEVSRVKSDNNWEILWAVPITPETDQDNTTPFAVLHVSTSIEDLKKAATTYNTSLAEIRLIQNIRLQKQMNFMTIGSGGGFGATVIPVPDSHWQIEVIPSKYFAAKAFYIPFWVIALMLLVTIAACYAAYYLANKKNLHIASLYQTLDVKFGTDDNQTTDLEPEDETTFSDPIYLSDQQIGISEEDQAIVTGANQHKQTASAADEGETSESDPDTSLQQAARQGMSTPAHIFRAYDIRGIAETELKPELITALGKAIASEAIDQGEHSLLVGYDTRQHSPRLKEHLQQGILSTGCNVIDIGLVPTPLLNFAAVNGNNTNSGVIVTASHNSKEYNGFKVVLNKCSLVADDIQRLKQRIEHGMFSHSKNKGIISTETYHEEYIDTVSADIAISPDLHIVIDAANGASSELAPKMFEELGCEITPLFCDFDGTFPNHDPDPSIAANLQALIDKVKEVNADLGIALDGDGDRLVIISASGTIVWPDILLMIFSRDVVSRNPGCDVIFDIKCTRHLMQMISSYGGRPIIWKTGHSNIKAKMRETNAMLAGEFSGHIFFKERWFGFDDGIYAAARLLEIMSLRDQSLDDILAGLPTAAATGEIRLPASDDDKFAIIDQLINNGDFSSGEKTIIDGLRVDYDKGWGLIRASNTSPSLTLRFEADNEEDIKKLKALFKREIKKIGPLIKLDF